MAQPGMQPLGGILANETVVIRRNGTASKPTINVKNGNVIAFQTEHDETQQWILQFVGVEPGAAPYPLTLFIPAKGGVTHLVVDWDSPTETTLYYLIEAFPANPATRSHRVMDGKNTIKIGSTPVGH